nr:MAG TPA: hypothetical protein [Caudoviricetes sp.]
MKLVVDRDKMIALSKAIQKKNGQGVNDLLSLDEMTENVNGIETGGSGMELPLRARDINFYDYDGTLLHAYTFEEASKLIRLPRAPEHEGLTFQCWNETDLSFIKKVRLPLDIGAIYTPTDGKTHLLIRTLQDQWAVTYQGVAIKGKMYINWGDGTEDMVGCSQFTTALTGNSSLTLSTPHTYEKAGEYEITVWGEDCDELLIDTYDFVNYSDNQAPCALLEVHYSDQVKRVGNAYGSYSGSALFSGYHLRKISIPNTVTSICAPLTMGYAYPPTVTLVLPPSLEEMLGAGSSLGGGAAKFIYPRHIKMFLGSSSFFLNPCGVSYLVMRFPEMQFVKKEENGRFYSNKEYPGISIAGNGVPYAREMYLMFPSMDKELTTKFSMLKNIPHLYVEDDDFDACYSAWLDAKKDRSSHQIDCKRISMKDGLTFTAEDAKNLGIPTTDKGAAIAPETSKVTGKTNDIDSGILYVTPIRPDEYDGIILEVGY